MRWTGHVVRMEERRSAFKILTGVSTGNRPLERPRRRWEDNINFEGISVDMRNWGDSTQDRDYWRGLMNATLNLWVP